MNAESRAAALAFVESHTGPLPETLEYTGEFGPELVLFLPFCHWLASVGLLHDRRIKTYRGMRCFYAPLDCVEIIEKDQRRKWLRPAERSAWLPVKNEHDFDQKGRPLLHLYPDLRAQFASLPVVPEIGSATKPILVIHNKHNIEWRIAPFNQIDVDTLDPLLTALTPQYTIVYIRHGMNAKDEGYSEDHNLQVPFDERDVLARHPGVLVFDDLFTAQRARGGTQDLNTFKNVVYSHCYHFISSQGGGAHQMALYSGSLQLVLHRRGEEETWAYGDGYYGFMARVPPMRAIVRNDAELLAALPLFDQTAISDDRVILDARNAHLLARYSPWTIASR